MISKYWLNKKCSYWRWIWRSSCFRIWLWSTNNNSLSSREHDVFRWPQRSHSELRSERKSSRYLLASTRRQIPQVRCCQRSWIPWRAGCLDRRDNGFPGSAKRQLCSSIFALCSQNPQNRGRNRPANWLTLSRNSSPARRRFQKRLWNSRSKWELHGITAMRNSSSETR